MPKGVQKGYEHIKGLSKEVRSKFGERLRNMEGCLDAMEYLYLNRRSNRAFLKNPDYDALDGGYCILRAEVNGNVDCREYNERYKKLVKILNKITKKTRLRANRHRLKRLKKDREYGGGDKDVEIFHLPECFRDEVNCYGTWPLIPAK